MKKYDAFERACNQVKLIETGMRARATCNGCLYNKECNNSFMQQEHCHWHKARNFAIRKLRYVLNITPFGQAPSDIYLLANQLADELVLDGILSETLKAMIRLRIYGY